MLFHVSSNPSDCGHIDYLLLSLLFPVYPGQQFPVNPKIEMIVNPSVLITGHIFTRVDNGDMISEAVTAGLDPFLGCRGKSLSVAL